jgi:DNA-3-methyladenine glycosylase
LADLARLLARSPVEVAPELLGAVISCGEVAVRLTEVEAYAGTADPGSHAFRRTPRSEIMFGPPGFLYCYFVYGMHVCANVVTGPDGDAGAVLLRAGEVIEGLGTARSRRAEASDRQLARGPALLCRALGIDLSRNGTDLSAGAVRLEPAASPPDGIRSGPRVGLRHAGAVPWRFWIDGEPTVSTYRPAAPRGRAGRGS